MPMFSEKAISGNPSLQLSRSGIQPLKQGLSRSTIPSKRAAKPAIQASASKDEFKAISQEAKQGATSFGKNLPGWFENNMKKWDTTIQLPRNELYPFNHPTDHMNYIGLHQNDYLRLSDHPRVKDARRSAIEEDGASFLASTVYSGASEHHVRLRSLLATIHAIRRRGFDLEWMGRQCRFGRGHFAAFTSHLRRPKGSRFSLVWRRHVGFEGYPHAPQSPRFA